MSASFASLMFQETLRWGRRLLDQGALIRRARLTQTLYPTGGVCKITRRLLHHVWYIYRFSFAEYRNNGFLAPLEILKVIDLR